MISLIVAMDKNNLIGNNSSMPWKIPEDLNLFKKITTDNIVIMGRKTFQSIGKALPNRINIVLTKNRNFNSSNIEVFNSPNSALEKAISLQIRLNKKIFIIGGKEIYEHFLPQVHELHISCIKGKYHGDTYFPRIDLSTFTLVNQIEFEEFTYLHFLKNTCNI